MSAYYNEIDPFAAEWLRELIKAGMIAPGEVDERSIEDVLPADIRGFSQHHFFAGIGVWSYALRQAGWSDDRPVWTGSCPCQPFSAAGKGAGFADERHLWPSFFHLIEQCRPTVVFGEQVASKAVEPWVDLVQADLEAVGYSFGCVPFPAASVGAPHIRDRAFWVADSSLQQFKHASKRIGRKDFERRGPIIGMANLYQNGCSEGRECGASTWDDGVVRNCSTCRMADCCGTGLEGRKKQSAREKLQAVERGGHVVSSSPTNCFWRDADWLFCRDGKWRPVEPGTFPLVNGAAQRVGRLRGYGNAIVAQQAQAFIKAFMEITK